MHIDCTSTNPIDITELQTGASSTQPGDSYGYQNQVCTASGFTEGDIVISVLVLWILILAFLVALDRKIYGSKVIIRQ